jgi:hypothetical protein
MNSRLRQFATSLVAAAKDHGLYFAVFGIFFLGLSFQAFGQEATILGTVTDSSGSVVPNVTVTLTQTISLSAFQYLAFSFRIKYVRMQPLAKSFTPSWSSVR